jgi:mRNA interferase MazF
MTSQEPAAGFPLTLESRAPGLSKRSWIKISQIRTLSVERIGARLARASEEELARIVDGLNEILG